MKNNKVLITIVAFLFSAFAVKAQQGETIFTIDYNAAFPTGSFKNILSSASYRGFKADILYGLSDKASIGLGTGFQDFYQKNPRQLYKLNDGSDLSAVTTYTIQTIPILAEVKYNFLPGGTVQPYAALGVGGNLVSYDRLFGEFGNRQGKIRFAARPEAGLHIPFNKNGAGFNLGVLYNIMPFKYDELKNLNSIGVHAGFSLPLRK